MSEEKPVAIMISKAPEGEEARRTWAKQMMRIQIAMWIDGRTHCEQCGHVYTDVDDFLERNPRSVGVGGDDFPKCVDDECFKVYKKRVRV